MTERGIRPASSPHVGPALLAPYRSRTFLAVLRPAVAMRDQDAALLALRVLGDPCGLPVRLALPPYRALRLASLAPFRPWPRFLREGLSSAATRSGGSSVPRPIREVVDVGSKLSEPGFGQPRVVRPRRVPRCGQWSIVLWWGGESTLPPTWAYQPMIQPRTLTKTAATRKATTPTAPQSRGLLKPVALRGSCTRAAG